MSKPVRALLSLDANDPTASVAWRTYVRVRNGANGRPEVGPQQRVFGPRGPSTGHPSEEICCPICDRPFVEGEYSVLIPLGPGLDEADRDRARRGVWYNALALEAHVACVTGREWEG